MKVTAISDLHGNFPVIEKTDILIIAGDIGTNGLRKSKISPIEEFQWLNGPFREWLKSVPAKHIVGIAGNHDLIFQKSPHLLPTDLPWHYLQDQGIELEGLRIWGSPWIVPIWGAFEADEADLKSKYSRIPDDIDILISHGPPHKIGDAVVKRVNWCGLDDTRWPKAQHCGSPALRERIFEIKPQLVVSGHIHEGFGLRTIDGILFANASILNRDYHITNHPLVFDIEPRVK